MDNKYTEILIKKQNQAEGDLILTAMPDNATLSRITAIQHGSGGKMVYSFDGKPFLEIYPPSFETVLEGRDYKIKATTSYRIIKND